jgi:hypothetical protein
VFDKRDQALALTKERPSMSGFGRKETKHVSGFGNGETKHVSGFDERETKHVSGLTKERPKMSKHPPLSHIEMFQSPLLPSSCFFVLLPSSFVFLLLPSCDFRAFSLLFS